MPNRWIVGWICFGLGGCAAVGNVAAPRPATTELLRIVPESLRWSSPPGVPHLQAAWVVGAEKETGAYLLRVHIAEGGHIPLHSHPDDRQTTVLSGTVYIGLGNARGEADTIPMPAGTVYVIPAGLPHSVSAKDGPVLYQEAGYGPTATLPPRVP